MTRSTTFDRTLQAATLLAVVCAVGHAQSGPTPTATVVLDPAHGGADAGARLSGAVTEKEVTWSLAARIRSLLVAQGFNVVLTREAEAAGQSPAATATADQRAETANRAHPLACLTLHATNAGRGVHLFTSALTPVTLLDEAKPVPPWATAQAGSIAQSLRLVNELSASLISARIPPLSGRASTPPMDSLTCPAVAVEVAPLANPDTTPIPVMDPAYLQRVAEAVANALISWRLHAGLATGQAAAGASR